MLLSITVSHHCGGTQLQTFISCSGGQALSKGLARSLAVGLSAGDGCSEYLIAVVMDREKSLQKAPGFDMWNVHK